jgi:hypothetical protein
MFELQCRRTVGVAKKRVKTNQGASAKQINSACMLVDEFESWLLALALN